MKKLNEDIYLGAICETKKCGKFKIIEYSDSKNVKIEFLDTGYVAIRQATCVRSGAITDPMFPSIRGIGFFGVGEYNSKNSPKAYCCWRQLLHRVADGKVRVCGDWLNFQSFAQWFVSQLGHHIKDYEIYRDESFSNELPYSPETCQIRKNGSNSKKVLSGKFSFINPQGKLVEGKNVNQLARDNGLNISSLKTLACGRMKTYKGWRKAP